MNKEIPFLELTKEEELEPEEETPEAFIPSFTVAPEEVPVTNVSPGDAQKDKTFQEAIKKLGYDAKQFMQQPALPITEEKERFVKDTSQLVAKILVAVSMWGYSVFGFEYSILAPTEEQADEIVRPLMRVVARHSKTVANVSPDYLDITASIKAMSDYANTSMAILQEIKIQKYGQINTRQTTSSNQGDRSRDYTDTSNNGHVPTHTPNAENGGGTVDRRNLTENERYNLERLSELAARDYQARARRAGKL